MHASDDDNFPLSQVANSLKPYLSTRQDALRIRRVLTIFLTSLLAYPPSASSCSLLLIASEQQTHDPEIPPEVSGLRKDYLEALKANLRARREARAAATQELEVDSRDPRFNSSTRAFHNTGDSLMNDYLALLRQRQRFARLRILQDYMNVLLQKPAAKPSYLDIGKIQLDAYSVPSMQQIPASTISPQEPSTSSALNVNIQELVIRLEKTIIRTKHNLEREQRLLANLRELQHNSCPSDDSDNLAPSKPGSKIHALNRTREELIGWIERELARTDSTSDQGHVEEELIDKPHQTTKTSAQIRMDIDDAYAEYIRARKRCLALVAEATSPLSSAPFDDTPSLSHINQVQSETNGSTSCSNLLDQFARLHVPLNQQKSLAQQKSFTASVLAKEQVATVESLDRLADESHLLPAYPLLAADKRFQTTAAALRSRRPALRVHPATVDSGQGMTLEMARRWVFAATAASASAREVVDGRITSCGEQTGAAKEILSDVRTLLGQTDVKAGAEIEEEDPWIPSVSAKAKSSKQRATLGHKSIWQELRGDIAGA